MPEDAWWLLIGRWSQVEAKVAFFFLGQNDKEQIICIDDIIYTRHHFSFAYLVDGPRGTEIGFRQQVRGLAICRVTPNNPVPCPNYGIMDAFCNSNQHPRPTMHDPTTRRRIACVAFSFLLRGVDVAVIFFVLSEGVTRCCKLLSCCATCRHSFESASSP